MVERVDRQGSLVSPHQHPVVPGESPEAERALLDGRISPELVLLHHVEGKDFHLVARGGQTLAHLSAPRLGSADRGRIALNEV
jgi:hypothetical protein